MAEGIAPVVGMGVTAVYPQDRYPFVITAVSASGKTLTLQPVKAVSRNTGHEAARMEGPFPIWDHTYTEEELKALVREKGEPFKIRLTKNGWSRRGTPYFVGEARYYRNYSY